MSRLRVGSRATPSFITRSAQLRVSRCRLVKEGGRLLVVSLRPSMYAARFPYRRNPRPAIPHADQPIRFIEPAARLIELSRLGERDR